MNNIEKKKMLISFSGGRTSAFMMQWLLMNKADQFEMKVVFANTGMENEKTLLFVKQCSDHFNTECIWVEACTNPIYRKGVSAKVVNFETASRNGEPFDKSNKKHGLPNQSTPHCTRELKANTIKAYLKEIGWKKYYTAIGIRVDEIDRMNANKDKLRLVYPLVSMIPTTKIQINDYWKKMPFDLQIREHEGNCNCCWKKSLKKLLTIAKEDPSAFDWWKSQEKKYENFVPTSRSHNPNIKLPVRMYRGNRSVDDIIELSKQPFEAFIDINFEAPNGCEESCEAF